MNDNDKLTVATHLYVRLRRHSGRVIDVVWMLRSPDYAREVLRLAREIADSEVRQLADRYEELATGISRERATLPSMMASAAQLFTLSPEVASRYRGALR